MLMFFNNVKKKLEGDSRVSYLEKKNLKILRDRRLENNLKFLRYRWLENNLKFLRYRRLEDNLKCLRA